MKATTVTSLTLSVLLMLLNSPSISTNRHELLIATKQMQEANYFTFVSLINMLPPDKIPPNVTFLMPNDEKLSKTPIPDNNVSNFLLRHSIPSPLLFDDLNRLPTNSIIPSSESGYLLNILNSGKRSFFLNNVKLTTLNVCVNGGSSIRCHGVDSVLVDINPISCSSNSDALSLPPQTSQLILTPPVPIYWIQASNPESSGVGKLIECLGGLVVMLVLSWYVY